MVLILRGKRLGVSLREVRGFTDLYDAGPAHIGQTRPLLAAPRRRIADPDEQSLSLDEPRDLETQPGQKLAQTPQRAMEANP